MMLALFGAAALAGPTDTLLLGNSYTQFNDLDARLAEALLATVPGSSPPVTRKLTSGGLRLPDHVDRLHPDTGDPVWQEALDPEGEWAFVVLQDQSQVPGFPMDDAYWLASRDAAVTLDGAADGVSAHTLLLLTWGRRAGDPGNPELYPDFSTMQGRLTEGYLAYAAAIEAAAPTRPPAVAPVGPAFAHIHDALLADGADPAADGTAFSALYDGDGSHPSRAGSVLAAHVLAASISGWPATGAALPGELDLDTLEVVQAAADAVTVHDPFGSWGFSWAVAWDDAVAVGDPAPSLGHDWQRWQVGVSDAVTVEEVELKDSVLRVLPGGALTVPDVRCSGHSAVVVDGGSATLGLASCAISVPAGEVAWSGAAAVVASLEVGDAGVWRVGPDRPALTTDTLAVAGALALDDRAEEPFSLASVGAEPDLSGAASPEGWVVAVAEDGGTWTVTLAPEGEGDPTADTGAAGDSGATGVQPRDGAPPAGCGGCGGSGAALLPLLTLGALRRRRAGG